MMKTFRGLFICLIICFVVWSAKAQTMKQFNGLFTIIEVNSTEEDDEFNVKGSFFDGSGVFTASMVKVDDVILDLNGNSFEIISFTADGSSISALTKSLNERSPAMGDGIIFRPSESGFPLITMDAPSAVLASSINSAILSVNAKMPTYRSGTVLPVISNAVGDVVLNAAEGKLYKLSSQGWSQILNVPQVFALDVAGAKKGDVVEYFFDNQTYVFNGSAWGTPASVPSLPVIPKFGDVFYHTGTQSLSLFDGSGKWKELGGTGVSAGSSISVSATPPTTPSDKDVYFDTDDDSFYKYNSGTTSWSVVSSGGGGIANGSITDQKLQASGGAVLSPGTDGQILTSAGNNQFKWTMQGITPSGADLPVQPVVAGSTFYETDTNQLWVSDGLTWVSVSTGGSTPSGSTPPSGSAAGDVFYDTDDQNLYFYDGTAWNLLSGVSNGASLPGSGTVGETFYNTTTNTYYVYDDGQWNAVGGLSATTAFTGDVSGTYNATKVEKIQNVGVSSTAPANGQVLKYDGTNWVPSADNSSTTTVVDNLSSSSATDALSANQGNVLNTALGTKLNSTAAFTGDVSGTYNATKVEKIQNVGVSSTAPANGQVLKYDGTNWVPSVDNSSTTTVVDNLSSSSATDALSANQGNVLNTALGTKLNSTAAFTGDVSGTYNATKVEKIQNVGVSSSAPANGQVLKYDGTNWVPSADNSSTTTVVDNLSSSSATDALSANQGNVLNTALGTKLNSTAAFTGDVSGTYNATKVEKIQNVGVSSTAPANGQVLKYDGTNWVPSVDNSSTTTVVDNLSSSSATDALSANQGNVLNTALGTKLNSTAAFAGDVSGTYNATKVEKIQNVGVSSTAPANGQVLKYDGTNWVPSVDNSSTTTVVDNLSSSSATDALSANQGNVLNTALGTKLNSTAAFTGDVSGTYNATKVEKIQNVGVSSTAPANGQVLKYDGTNWVPSGTGTVTSLSVATINGIRGTVNNPTTVPEISLDLGAITPTSIAVNASKTAPASSAALDVSSTTQGVLVPRMTSAQRTAITSPAVGLMVYQSDAPEGFYYYSSGGWTAIGGGGGADATTASNGLTETGDDIQLGGTLTKTTTISQANNDLTLSTGTGNAIIDGALRIANNGSRSGLFLPFSEVTVAPNTYTVLDTDIVLYFTFISSGTTPLYLPAASVSNAGRVLFIHNITQRTITITDSANSLAYPLVTGKGSIVYCTGSKWISIAN